MPIKRLKPSEVRSENRQYCDFNRQEIRVTRAGAQCLHIWVKCPICNQGRWLQVSRIRPTGHVPSCLPCYNRLHPPPRKFKPLTLGEVCIEHRQYCDFSRQEVRKGSRHVLAKCPNCGKARWVSVSRIRRDAHVPCCRLCANYYVENAPLAPKPLKPSEVCFEHREYCDFAHQEIIDGRLHIWAQCPHCKEPRWQRTATIRHEGCPKYCASCSTHINNYQGGHVNGTGYRVVSLFSLSKEDHALASPMTSKTNVVEHRLIMARHLGRPLDSSEHVHHRNGDRLDNRLANLRLVTRQTHNTAPADDIAKLSVEIEHLARTAAINKIDAKPLLQHFIKELRSVAGQG